MYDELYSYFVDEGLNPYKTIEEREIIYEAYKKFQELGDDEVEQFVLGIANTINTLRHKKVKEKDQVSAYSKWVNKRENRVDFV
jgi:glutamate racemase